MHVLNDTHVVIIGAGGLGCPALWHLAAAGVGHLTIVDYDVVDLSNLNRQVLYRSHDIGRPKVECAAERIRRAFPAVHIDARAQRVDADSCNGLFRAADFIIDATDGVAAKFLINDAAVAAQKPLSHAGILGFLGQTMTIIPGQSACLRCLFPEPPPADTVPTCQESGILGAVAGVIGSAQAQSAMNYLRDGSGGNVLVTFDGLTTRWRTIGLRANPRCPLRACREPATGAAHHPAV